MVFEASARTPSQVYVAGEFAQSLGDFAAATKYFGTALQSDPTDVLLQRRVFDLSLRSGDIDRAVRLARTLVKDAPNDSQLLVVLAIEAIRKNDWASADTHLSSLSAAGLDAILGPVLKSWVAVGRGKPEEANGFLAVLDKTPSFRPFAAEQRAWIALVTGNWKDANESFAPLLGETGINGSLRMRIAAASAAQRAGDSSRAIKILSGESEHSAHPWLLVARQTLSKGEMLAPPVTDAHNGIAEMLRRIALDMTRDDNPQNNGTGFAWLSSRLSPDTSETVLTLADVLTAAKQGEQALQLVDLLPKDEAGMQIAIMTRARILTALGRDKDVIDLLTSATRNWPHRSDFWTTLADAQRNIEQYDDAIASYTKSIELTGAPKENDWGLYFVRGIAYERLKKWDQAEADLKKSLALKPNQATVLNYLGYSWLERKTNLEEATKMIELALEQRPSDGAIIDSLGWSLYLRGEIPAAIERLEDALVYVPNDPTVNEHLGDAYWVQGRFIEARHRWQAALDAEPQSEQVQRLNSKLEFGLNETVSNAGKQPKG